MDNSISSARQKDNSGIIYTTPSKENEIEFKPVPAEEDTENTGDSTYSLLDKESQSPDLIVATEKNKAEYVDSLINPALLVTEDNDNIISTQSQLESKDYSHAEDEDLEHIESEHQDDDLLFVHP